MTDEMCQQFISSVLYFYATKLSETKLRQNMTPTEIIYNVLQKRNCSIPSKLCIDTNCQTCFDKSFASCEKSVFIMFENPRYLTKFSNKNKTFKCNKCNLIIDRDYNGSRNIYLKSEIK